MTRISSKRILSSSDYGGSLIINLTMCDCQIKSKRKKKRRSKEDQECDLENAHWNLQSCVRETSRDNRDILLDYQTFYKNLVKYSHVVPAYMRTRPMFKFLCFILNDRNKNMTVLSHYGSR